MGNDDTTAARDFHLATKLKYIDLKTKPPLYKSYFGLESVPFPSLPPLETPTLPAVAHRAVRPAGPLDYPALAQLLHYSAGLVRRSEIPSAGEVHYRAAASAGALYPVELYVVSGDLPGLPAGVFHFSPPNNCLERLREGDHRGYLAEAAAGDPAVAAAAATIVCTTVFWRSAWKYRTRGYRYCYWDNGTIVSNMLAAANALGHPSRIVGGFVDASVDRILGVDGTREASVCLVPVGSANPSSNPSDATGGESLGDSPTGDLGDDFHVVYPESDRLHTLSRLETRQEVAEWRGAVGETAPSASEPGDWPDSGALDRVVARRGSTRRFDRVPISADQLTALLDAAAAPFATDYPGPLIDTYLIVNAVDGVAPGAYFYAPGEGPGTSHLELLLEGELREEAGHLCFEQALGADASVVAFFMADLEQVLARLGNRGYRTAQLEAGVAGGRMYLCAHSMGLGATGMTFFDDAVTAFFSPHASAKSLMFLVGLGATAKPNQVRPFRSRIGMLKDSLARGATGGRRSVPDWYYD